jgi:diacylglycerol kinase (ATP)
MPDQKNILFVINPISGDVDKTNLEVELAAFAKENGFTPSFFFTTGRKDKKRLKALINWDTPGLIVAVGGDGTVSLVGDLLINTNKTLGIIPMGSGNGLSKDIGIPQEFDEALEVLVEGEVHAIDTLLINGIASLHLSDLGFNALVVKRFAEGQRRGPAAYAWHVMREYVGYQSCEYEVKTADHYFKGKAFMLTIANANMFGSNATINPQGIINDGYFEICILEEFPKTAGIGILYQMFSAEIHQSLHSRIIRCREAIIRNPQKSPIQIDGEPYDNMEELKVSILPSSLRVLTDRP